MKTYVVLWYDKLWYFDKKFLKAYVISYDLLLFLFQNLFLGVVHESHAGPVAAYCVRVILKSFTIFSKLPNI